MHPVLLVEHDKEMIVVNHSIEEGPCKLIAKFVFELWRHDDGFNLTLITKHYIGAGIVSC